MRKGYEVINMPFDEISECIVVANYITDNQIINFPLTSEDSLILKSNSDIGV